MAESDRDWSERLWQGCKNAELDNVNEAISRGADRNWRNPNFHHYSPLHIAIKSEREEVVELLLKQGVDTSTLSDDGYTPLSLAAENGAKSIVKLLLEKGVDPDLKDSESALHKAAQNDHVEVADLLLSFNASIDLKTEDGDTALLLASSSGHVAMVQYLLSKQANIGITNKGFTALHLASLHGCTEVVRVLLDKGADPNTISDNGFTPLITAAKNGSREIAQLLMQAAPPNGADVTAVGYDGNTALHIAAELCQREIVQLLVKKGANLDRLNKDGDTALHMGCRKGHTAVVRLLLSYGAKPELKNKEGKTAFNLAEEEHHQMTTKEIKRQATRQQFEQQEHSKQLPIDEALWNACFENNVAESDRLLSLGANPNWRNQQWNDYSCLDVAVLRNYTDILKILLHKHAQAKGTALHVAASYGHVEPINDLISAGTAVNTPDEDEDTPLHNAAAYGHLEAVKVLIQSGAVQSLKRKNKHGMTPLEVAQKRNRLQVVMYLQEASTKQEESASSTTVTTDVMHGYEVALKASKESEETLQAKVAELEEELLAKEMNISALTGQLEQKESELERLQQKSTRERSSSEVAKFSASDDPIPAPTLDEDNAVFLLTKHKFPPAKWRELAIGLKQIKAIRSIKADSGDAISQLVALITHWVGNDQEMSWEKLVEAVEMSEEKVVAERLAADVGVPYPGASAVQH